MIWKTEADVTKSEEPPQSTWAAIIKYYRPTTEIYFFIILEAENSRSVCQHCGVLVRALFLARRGLPSHCVLTSHLVRGGAGKEKESVQTMYLKFMNKL